jgi:hypothetical protein
MVGELYRLSDELAFGYPAVRLDPNGIPISPRPLDYLRLSLD